MATATGIQLSDSELLNVIKAISSLDVLQRDTLERIEVESEEMGVLIKHGQMASPEELVEELGGYNDALVEIGLRLREIAAFVKYDLDAEDDSCLDDKAN